MLLLERKVLSDQSVNLIRKQIVTFEISSSMKQSGFNLATHPINHALDQLDLAVAEPVLVGDVVSDS